MAAKDFGSIENDYAFFMSHATEAENDVAGYARELERFGDGRGTIRMLDFGCGTGELTQRFLSAMNWTPHVLDLTLVEPVRRQREHAAQRLARFSEHAIASMERLPSENQPRFDLILSNHVLYFVNDIGTTLRQLIDALAPGGRLVLAIAGWDNMLSALWKTGFGLLGRPVPYYTAEDVEATLSQWEVGFCKTVSPYQLRFPDTVENRLKILRFLFAEHLQEISAPRLLGEFDRYLKGNEVEVNTHSNHFTVEASANRRFRET